MIIFDHRFKIAKDDLKMNPSLDSKLPKISLKSPTKLPIFSNVTPMRYEDQLILEPSSLIFLNGKFISPEGKTILAASPK